MRLRDGKITARMMYDLAVCEHRTWMDQNGDPSARRTVSPFVEMLWRHSREREGVVVGKKATEALNLRGVPVDERAAATLEAMRGEHPLIYGGRIEADDLCGEPDLLRLVDDGQYVPGDIKSGSADEGPSGSDRKPKERYAVQLALYVNALELLGLSAGRRGFIWDIRDREVEYDLAAPKGPRTPSSFWDDYLAYLALAREAIAGNTQTEPAACAACKLCIWYTECLTMMRDRGDLTLIPGLGRSMRDSMLPYVETISDLAAMSPERFLDGKGKSIVKGLGADSIRKFHARAVLITTNGPPYLTREVTIPSRETELFFDLETNPSDEHCYLHGFLERRTGTASERYVPFFSSRPEEEGETFARAWRYVQSCRPCTIYVYSKTERGWWRHLQQRYVDVCSAEEVDDLFSAGNCVDLLGIVTSSTEWPTEDRSLKTLAHFLGFTWRDQDPSGAASIEWYDRCQGGDRDAQQRILDYNEDDCIATRVLLDGIRGLAAGALG